VLWNQKCIDNDRRQTRCLNSKQKPLKNPVFRRFCALFGG